MLSDDTIIAQASPYGCARRGIVRLSGSDSLKVTLPFYLPCAPLIFKAQLEDLSKPFITRGRYLVSFLNHSKITVPCALFYWPSQRGFTGEEAVELHIPSSPSILDSIVREICENSRVRLAQRGEFTMRAFLSGRIDLTQAEGILGTIDATNDLDLKSALRQLSGSLANDLSQIRDNLLNTLSDLEAGFDFVDEDIEFISFHNLQCQLKETLTKIDEILLRCSLQITRDTLPLVILVGLPNAGKSSLFNKMIERFDGQSASKALVSSIEGTTRDYLEAKLTIDSTQFLLVDSPGIEKIKLSELATVRSLAQNNLKNLFERAALLLHCYDYKSIPNNSSTTVTDTIPFNVPELNVFTKQDSDLVNNLSTQYSNSEYVMTSSLLGTGIEELGQLIVNKLKKATESEREILPSTATRCQVALYEAKGALNDALSLFSGNKVFDDFLLASNIRIALARIGLITGEIHTEDLLDRIFSRFCVGK